MLSKASIALVMVSLAALAAYYFVHRQDEAMMERKVAGQLDALRKHLFRH